MSETSDRLRRALWGDKAPDPPAAEPVDDGRDRAGGIVFQDILPAFRGELPPPNIIVDDLLYDVGVHGISGHPGSGKSLITMACADALMADDYHVVWLDWEQGVRMTGQRLREMGVPEARVAEKFHYAYDSREPDKFLADVRARFGDKVVVVFDSMSKVLSRAGKSENSPEEVTAWMLALIDGSRAHGLPIIVIDHVSKASKSEDKYARGSGSKQADLDVHWKIEVIEPFDRSTSGVVRMYRSKDREGYLPQSHFYRVGDGAGGLPIVPCEDPRINNDQKPDQPVI